QGKAFYLKTTTGPNGTFANCSRPSTLKGFLLYQPRVVPLFVPAGLPWDRARGFSSTLKALPHCSLPCSCPVPDPFCHLPFAICELLWTVKPEKFLFYPTTESVPFNSALFQMVRRSKLAQSGQNSAGK